MKVRTMGSMRPIRTAIEPKRAKNLSAQVDVVPVQQNVAAVVLDHGAAAPCA